MLKPHQLEVLDCLSEGMSNLQIAAELRYKNARTAATIIYNINKELGLDGVYSTIERRTLLINAYKKYSTTVINIPMAEDQIARLIRAHAIDLNGSAKQIESLLRRGYRLERVEIIFRRPS